MSVFKKQNPKPPQPRHTPSLPEPMRPSPMVGQLRGGIGASERWARVEDEIARLPRYRRWVYFFRREI